MDEAQMAELQLLRERVVEVQGLQVNPCVVCWHAFFRSMFANATSPYRGHASDKKEPGQCAQGFTPPRI